MSTTSSSSSSISQSLDTADPVGTDIGRPGIVAGRCDYQVEEHSHSHGKVTWINCCSQENPEKNCPPQVTTYGECPGQYFNCADPKKHGEMCSPDAIFSGYSDSNSLNKKCCPENFACGPSFWSPCKQYRTTSTIDSGGISEINDTFHAGSTVLTNPQYLSVPGIFPGCNDKSSLVPMTIGAIVAAAIIGFVALAFLFLCCIRRQLYRDPARRNIKQRKKEQAAAMRKACHERKNSDGSGGIEMGRVMHGIKVTREIKIEEKQRSNDHRQTHVAVRSVGGLEKEVLGPQKSPGVISVPDRKAKQWLGLEGRIQ